VQQCREEVGGEGGGGEREGRSVIARIAAYACAQSVIVPSPTAPLFGSHPYLSLVQSEKGLDEGEVRMRAEERGGWRRDDDTLRAGVSGLPPPPDTAALALLPAITTLLKPRRVVARASRFDLLLLPAPLPLRPPHC
jgi:hypothetical protein